MNIEMITDDFAVTNVVKNIGLKIQTSSLMTEGIRYSWKMDSATVPDVWTKNFPTGKRMSQYVEPQ